MSTARRLAATSDQIDFGAIDLSGGSGVNALTIHARLRFDASALAIPGSGMWLSQWGAVSGNGAGFLLGILAGHGSHNVSWLLGVGNGAYAGCGTTGNPLAADGNYHSLVVTFGPLAAQQQIWLDGVQLATTNSGFFTGGAGVIPLGLADLTFGAAPTIGDADAITDLCDVGIWGSILGSTDIGLLNSGNPSSVVSPSTLLAFSDVADTTQFRRVGASTVSGTLTGTTAVSGPSLLTPYALEVTPSATSLNVTASVTIATAFGPYGSPGGTVTITPAVTGGTISPTSGAVGTTFTFTAGLAGGAGSVTFNNDGGLNAPVVNLTINALPAQLRSAQVCKSGQSIALQFERTSDHTPSNLTVLTTAPTVKVNGATATLAPTIWLDPTIGFGAYPFALLQFAQPPVVTAIVAETDAGFHTSGAGWVIKTTFDILELSYAYAADHTQHYTDAPSDTASWTFTGLAAGIYRVCLNWIALAGNTTHVAATVHDGGTVGAATLGTVAVDQTGRPQGLSTAGAAWTPLGDFTISGTSLTVQIANAAGAGSMWAGPALVRTIVPSPVAIQPGDAVTLTAPSSWGTCVAGAIGPLQDFAVDNRAGHPFEGDFVADAKRLQVCFNVQTTDPVEQMPFANLYKHAKHWNQNDDGLGNLASMAGILPAAGDVPRAFNQFLAFTGNGVDNRGIGNGPGDASGSGRWKLRYSIPSGSNPAGGFLQISSASRVGITEDSVIAVAVAEHTAGDGKREVEYDISCDRNTNSPQLCLNATDVPGHDIEIYGPSKANPLTAALTPDPSHPFNPDFIAILTAMHVTSLRFLDFTGTNNNSDVDFADLASVNDDRVSFSYPLYRNTSAIASIGPTDMSGADADRAQAWYPFRPSLKITFAAPHGLKTGQVASIYGPTLTHECYGAGGAIAGHNLTLVSGTTTADERAVFVVVQSATVIIITSLNQFDAAIDTAPSVFGQPSSWAPGTVEAVPGGQTWYMQVQYGFGAPYEQAVDLCNQVPDCGPYLNIPYLLSDAAITSVADLVYARLAAGRKVRWEYTNEAWNPGFTQSSWMVFSAFYHTTRFHAGDPGEVDFASANWNYYGYRAAQVFAIVRARAAAAGRAADCICVLGTNQGDGSVTDAVVGYAAVGGSQADEVAGAPYKDTPYFGPAGESSFPAMTLEQLLDVQEVGWALATSQAADHVTLQHYQVLKNRGVTVLDRDGRYVSGVKMIGYEGGPQDVLGNVFGLGVPWRAEHAHAMYLHPRQRDIAMAMFRRCDDQDMFILHKFTSWGITGWGSGTCWPTWPGYLLENGTGDGTDGKFDNRTDPEDPRCVSVFGQAALDWNALAAPSPPATGYTAAGPGSATVGAASADFTITVNGSFTGTITATPSGCGLAYPIVRVFSGTDRPQTFTVTPVAPGTFTLTFTNDGGFADPAPLTCTVTAPGSFHLDGPPAFSVTPYWTTYTRFELNSILQNPATNPDGFMARLPLGGGRHVVCCSTPPGFSRALVTDLAVPLGPGTVTAPGRYINQRISGSPWPYGAPDTITINPIDGSWFGIGHVEQYPNGVSFVAPTYYSLYAIMRSVDLGVTWNYCGVVVSPQITQADTFSRSLAVNVGIGSLAVVGPWLYTHFCEYKTAWSDYSNASNFGLGVARTDASAAFAAAIAGTVTPWSKWDGTGWSEAGLGGLGAYIVPTVAYPSPGNGVYGTEFFTFYHRGLGKYVGTNGAAGQPSGNQIKILFSDDLIHWSDPILLPTTEPATDNYQYVTFWPTDPTGDDGISGDGSLLLTYLAYGTDFSQATLRQRTITFDGLGVTPGDTIAGTVAAAGHAVSVSFHIQNSVPIIGTTGTAAAAASSAVVAFAAQATVPPPTTGTVAAASARATVACAAGTISPTTATIAAASAPSAVALATANAPADRTLTLGARPSGGGGGGGGNPGSISIDGLISLH